MNPYWNCNFFEFFAQFIQRIPALLTGASITTDELQMFVLCAIAIACGLLGPFLVLNRMTMLANSISHTILLGIVLSFTMAGTFFGLQGTISMGHLLIGAFLSALLTAFCTGYLQRTLRLQEDASIGLVFTALFSLGILSASLLTKNVHLGIEAVMGNVDALQKRDLFHVGSLALINLMTIVLFYWPLYFFSFDRKSAHSLGLSCRFLQFFLLFLTAASCVGAFRAVGVLLVLSFLVGPFLTARLFSNRLRTLLMTTPLIGCAASCLGVALARHFLSMYGLALSTGGLVATLLALFYPCARVMLFKRKKSVHAVSSVL